jgi:hypothetical protein
MSQCQKHPAPMVLIGRKDVLHGLGHLDFVHSILFRISSLEFSVSKYEPPTHPYRVLLQSHVLWA